MNQILVVDDEPAICDFVQAFLEDEGYGVRIGRNGIEALHQVQRHRPDLVLMDVMMPGLNGSEVVRQLHEQPSHAAIPVILMSAAARWDQAIDGPIQFLRKPFDLDRLLGMIGATLQRDRGPDVSSNGDGDGDGAGVVVCSPSHDITWIAESYASNLD